MAEKAKQQQPRFAFSFPVTFVLSAIAYIYFSTVFVFIDRWLGLFSSPGIANAAVFTAIAVMSLFSYRAAISTDPGRVPATYTPDIEDNTTPLHEIKRKFTDENGQREYIWQTSWAVSTRFVGGIIMTHGDDAGLMLPPKIAPIQVVIVPIWKKDDEKMAVLNAALSVKEALKSSGVKVKLDDSDQRTPGWKFNFWEMKGVPLRIEIGPRDVSSGNVVISRRDIPGKQGKVFGISMEPSILEAYVKDKLEEIQSSLLERAIAFRDSNIVDVSTYDDLKAAISQGKWARGPWSASDEDELKVKEETGATIRCFPFEQPQGIKRCLMTGDPAEEVAIFAKSY